jgi:hypothetical protein
MNNFSKLMLSDEEQQLVNNSHWILTKRVIMDKVHQLFGDVAGKQKIIIQQEKDWLPAAVLLSEAKISKGENYLQLPFLILDYPRCFDVENIFAVRTMFWWGNFFSITFHLSGTYKIMYQDNLIAALDKLKPGGLYLCISESQWHHHFEEDNYTSVNNLTQKEIVTIIRQKQFIKLAVKFPLNQWDEIPALLEKKYMEIIELLKT